MSPSQWQVIAPLIAVQRQSKWPLKRIVEALLFMTKHAISWRDLPDNFPPWQTVYWYFRKWQQDHTLEAIAAELTLRHRLLQDRSPWPSQAIVDAQSVATTNTAREQVGFDGYKRIKGRQRLIAVDTLGNLLWVSVVAANRHEGRTAAGLWPLARLSQPLLDKVRLIYADASFGGGFARAAAGVGQQVVVPAHPLGKNDTSFAGARRWIVERNFGWLSQHRRLSKDYEGSVRSSEAFIWLAHIRRTLKWAGK